MEMIAFIKLLKPYIDGGLTVYSFVKDDMAKILERIGDVQLDAAMEALEGAPTSNNPTREIESAITCFRIARKFYLEAAKETFLRDFLSQFARVFSPKLLKASQISLLMAICYKALSDSQKMNENLDAARKHFRKYCEAYEYEKPPIKSQTDMMTGRDPEDSYTRLLSSIELEKGKKQLEAFIKTLQNK